MSPDASSAKKGAYESLYYKLGKPELITMITKMKDQVKVMTQKHEEDADLIDKMRHGYLKELANLRE